MGIAPLLGPFEPWLGHRLHEVREERAYSMRLMMLNIGM